MPGTKEKHFKVYAKISLDSLPQVKKREAGHPPKAAHPNDTRTSVNYINATLLFLLHIKGRILQIF